MNRGRYLGRRIVFSAMVVWVLSSLLFVLLYVWPLDPAAAVQAGMGDQDLSAIRSSLGLNDPLLTQYGEFMTRGLTFDYSESWVLGPDDEPDKYIRMHERLPRTLWVTALAIPVALATVWVPDDDEGRLSLWRLLGRSLPGFFFAIVLQGLLLDSTNPLGIEWKTFIVDTSTYVASSASNRPPPIAVFDPEGLLVALKWYAPAGIAVGLALGTTVLLLRTVTGRMERDRPYVELARAKGLGDGDIDAHAASNALLPLVMLLPTLTNVYLGTIIVVERILGVEGVGEMFAWAVRWGDVPLVGSLGVGFVVLLALSILLRDVLVVWLSGLAPPDYTRRLGIESVERWRPTPPQFRGDRTLRPSLPFGGDDGLLARVRATPGPAMFWVTAGVVLLGLELGALASAALELPPWDVIVGAVTGLLRDVGAGAAAAIFVDAAASLAGATTAVADLPTLLSRELVPNRGHWTGSQYENTFAGTSPALSWAVRVTLVYLYVAALLCWAGLGYRLYRIHYRRADRTAMDEVLSSLRSDRMAQFGLLIVVGFVAFAVFAPTVAPTTGPKVSETENQNEFLHESFNYYDRETGTVRSIQRMFANQESESGQYSDTDVGAMQYDKFGRFHPFGTDWDGFDLFTRMAFSARTYLGIAAVGTAIAAGFSLLVATLVAGRRGSMLPTLTEFAEAVPMLPGALIVGFAFQNQGLGRYWDGGILLAAVLALVLWTPLWRSLVGVISRGRRATWSDAARTAGASRGRLLMSHALVPSVCRFAGHSVTLFAGLLLSIQSMAWVNSFGIYPIEVWVIYWPNFDGAWHLTAFSTAGFFVVVAGFVALGTALRNAATVPEDTQPDPAGELTGVGTGG